MHRADHALRPAPLSQGGARRADRPGEGALADRHVGPHGVEELALRHRAVSVLEQVDEQVEHLGLGLDGLAPAAQLEHVRVEHTVGEAELH